MKEVHVMAGEHRFCAESFLDTYIVYNFELCKLIIYLFSSAVYY